jgi:hypothetical protein
VTQVWSGSNVRRSDSRERLVFPALKARASLHARAIGEEVPVTWTEKSHAPALHATYRSPISRRVVPPSADSTRSILIHIFLLQRDIELLLKMRISLPSQGAQSVTFQTDSPVNCEAASGAAWDTLACAPRRCLGRTSITSLPGRTFVRVHRDPGLSVFAVALFIADAAF